MKSYLRRLNQRKSLPWSRFHSVTILFNVKCWLFHCFVISGVFKMSPFSLMFFLCLVSLSANKTLLGGGGGQSQPVWSTVCVCFSCALTELFVVINSAKLCGADGPLWRPNHFKSRPFNQRIRRNILFKCARVCLCVWVVFIPWVARLSVFPFVFRSRLLFVMAGVQGAFACCPASCLSALLFACVCVYARPGAKSIVYNLWVWSAVDTNSHFSVYCWLSALRRACDVGRLCSINTVINPFS